jgi:hypothetical protein
MDNQRISPITGLPVRKYTKKVKNQTIPQINIPSNVVKNKDFIKKADFFNETNIYQFKIQDLQYNTLKRSIYIIGSPTANCQLLSIRKFDILLLNSSHLKEQLIEIGQIKPLIFVDIKQNLKTRLYSKIDKKAIISESNYISSNNSEMCAIIINTKKL